MKLEKEIAAKEEEKRKIEKLHRNTAEYLVQLSEKVNIVLFFFRISTT
jgi:hypothetical protein